MESYRNILKPLENYWMIDHQLQMIVKMKLIRASLGKIILSIMGEQDCFVFYLIGIFHNYVLLMANTLLFSSFPYFTVG